MADKKFAAGMNCRVPTDKAQQAGLVTKLGFNVEKFYAWAREHEDDKGWVNVGVWISPKTHDHYASLDEWKPNRDERPVIAQKPIDEIEVDDDIANSIPF